jgi:hypothetical protein
MFAHRFLLAYFLTVLSMLPSLYDVTSRYLRVMTFEGFSGSTKYLAFLFFSRKLGLKFSTFFNLQPVTFAIKDRI